MMKPEHAIGVQQLLGTLAKYTSQNWKSKMATTKQEILTVQPLDEVRAIYTRTNYKQRTDLSSEQYAVILAC